MKREKTIPELMGMQREPTWSVGPIATRLLLAAALILVCWLAR